jgi:hypothetical protein
MFFNTAMHIQYTESGAESSRCMHEPIYSVRVKSAEKGNEVARAGLCADCRFMRRMKSDRGAIFFLCERSAIDPAFPKYPRLPVLECSRYEQVSAQGERSPL